MKNLVLLSLTLSTVVAQADGFMMNMVGRTVKNGENENPHGVVEGGLNLGGKFGSYDEVTTETDKKLAQKRHKAKVAAIEANLKVAFQEDAEQDPSTQYAQFRFFQGTKTVITDALGKKSAKVVLTPIGAQSKDRHGTGQGGGYVPPNDYVYETRHGLKEDRFFLGWTFIVHRSEGDDTAVLPSDLAVGRGDREKSEYSVGSGVVNREQDDGTFKQEQYYVRYKNQRVWCKDLTKLTSVCMNRDMAANLGSILTVDAGVGANLVRQISEPGDGSPFYFFVGAEAEANMSMPFRDTQDTRGAYKGGVHFGISGY